MYMTPADDEQRRHEMAAGIETLRLQPPPPPTTPTLKNNNLIPVSTTDYFVLVDDVLTEILLRLPAKSLIRFKSVCKNWLSLISSDHFCHHHTLRHPKLQPSLILQTHIGQFFYFNPTLTTIATKMVPYNIPTLPYHKIRQACNGLLLLESKVETSYDPTTKRLQRHLKRSYYVYNPTTRESREIILAYNDEYPYVASINLAFDPSKSPFYKIVCIMCNEERVSYDPLVFKKEHIYRGDVYDSERQTWMLGLETLTSIHSGTRLHAHGVYWNNAIYWSDGYKGYYYFDIDNNQFKTTSCSSILPCLQKSRNTCHLYYFKLVYKDEDEDEDEDGYLKKHHHVVRPRPDYLRNQGMKAGTIVRFMDGDGDGDGDGECGLLTCRAGNEKRAYNFLDETIKYENVVDLGEWYDHALAYPFAEILALV